MANLSHDQKTIEKARIRRRILYSLWLQGVSPTEASRREFQLEKTGDKIGPFARSTVREDYAFFEREAARDFRMDGQRERIATGIWGTVARLGEKLSDGDDRGGDMAKLGMALFEGYKLLIRIFGLEQAGAMMAHWAAAPARKGEKGQPEQPAPDERLSSVEMRRLQSIAFSKYLSRIAAKPDITTEEARAVAAMLPIEPMDKEDVVAMFWKYRSDMFGEIAESMKELGYDPAPLLDLLRKKAEQ